MGDLQFAKQFLTSLDNKSTKYQADHVFDPKTYQMRIPYTLPKLSCPPHPQPPKTKPVSAPAPGSESAKSTVSLTLKSARNPTMTLTLPQMDPSSTTVQSLKEQVQSHLGGSGVVQIDKIKLLLNKKPIPPSKKTVAEALDEKEAKGDIELGVMVMGGAPDPPPQVQVPPADMAGAPEREKAAVEAESRPTPMEGVETVQAESRAPVQPGQTSGEIVLQTDEFWNDLQGFLEQRIRDQGEAVRLRGVFERAWKSEVSRP
ncbi:hypothetical protein LTR67_008758 [Exophiala xenobiotica]